MRVLRKPRRTSPRLWESKVWSRAKERTVLLSPLHASHHWCDKSNETFKRATSNRIAGYLKEHATKLMHSKIPASHCR